MGYSPWSHTESDMTEGKHFHFFPLQGVWVRSLVRELRSYLTQGMAPPKKSLTEQ